MCGNARDQRSLKRGFFVTPKDRTVANKQAWAIYYKELEKWKKSRPKNGNNYDLEAWLEEKPQKPNELPS